MGATWWQPVGDASEGVGERSVSRGEMTAMKLRRSGGGNNLDGFVSLIHEDTIFPG